MSESQKGNLYIVSEMIIWSLFPIVSKFGFTGVSPLVSLFWVNVFATIFFACLIFNKKNLLELKNEQVWLYTLGVVIFICVFFYGFYFYGLSKTSPSNAAIVALFEIVPTYIFFQLIKKENLDRKHLLGILLGVVGVLVVLLPSFTGINTGDLIILFATIFPPIGNWYQQKVRKFASTNTILFLRHLLSLPFLAIIVLASGQILNSNTIEPIIGWLILNGVIIFGFSKILWVESIHRMSVTKALAISGLNPIFTVLFSWLLLSVIPTATQLVALPFLILSVLILTDFKFSSIRFFYKNNSLPNDRS